MFAQGGEFAFVLYADALAAGIMDAETAAGMTAIVILSMALTPLVVIAVERLTPAEKESMDGIEEAADLHGRVLFVGFGRFAQVVSQPLLAKGIDVSIIEIDVEMIRAAGQFRFQDLLWRRHAARCAARFWGRGMPKRSSSVSRSPKSPTRSSRLAKSEFPHAKIYARAFDRGHALRLIKRRRRLPAARNARVRLRVRSQGASPISVLTKMRPTRSCRCPPTRRATPRTADRQRIARRPHAHARQHGDHATGAPHRAPPRRQGSQQGSRRDHRRKRPGLIRAGSPEALILGSA